MDMENLNIVFAMDHSGSMNQQDGQKTVPQMLKALSETIQGENINIGYTAYNDTILAKLAPVPVATKTQRDILWDAIKSVDYRGETDVGLGLSEAYRLLDDCTGKKMLVLVSDGETDLGRSATGRTEEESQADIEAVVKACEEEGTPIVAIAFGETYEGEKSSLESMAEQTGGAAYTAKNPEELVGIFYTLADMIEKRNLDAQVEWEAEPYKNAPAAFTVRFYNEVGNAVNPPESLKAPAWYAHFRDTQTGNTVPVRLSWENNSLSGTVTFEKSGRYELSVGTGQDLGNVYGIFEAEALNTLPSALVSEGIEINTTDNDIALDLHTFFADADGDALTFELQGAAEAVTARIEGDVLWLAPQGAGSGDIAILVSDGEGSLLGQIPVKVKTPAVLFAGIGIAAAIALLLVARIAAGRRKRVVAPKPELLPERSMYSFTGKLNAYFTRLPSEEEIPPLTFALHQIRERKLVLGDMFKAYPEPSDILGLQNICLVPAENRKLILYHNSNSTVMIGNSIVCRKMQYEISYGNVIYITSADQDCELEIHYVSMIQ